MGGRDQMTLIICLLRRHVIRLVPDEKVATFTLELPLASHEPGKFILVDDDTADNKMAPLQISYSSPIPIKSVFL